MKTYVRFIIFKGEVLAVFMRRSAKERYSSASGTYLRQCYSYIGQHGECYDGMQRRKRATPEQYAPLKQEMESIGYELEVI